MFEWVDIEDTKIQILRMDNSVNKILAFGHVGQIPMPKSI